LLPNGKRRPTRGINGRDDQRSCKSPITINVLGRWPRLLSATMSWSRTPSVSCGCWH
jgi:hypothetical protein